MSAAIPLPSISGLERQSRRPATLRAGRVAPAGRISDADASEHETSRPLTAQLGELRVTRRCVHPIGLIVGDRTGLTFQKACNSWSDCGVCGWRKTMDMRSRLERVDANWELTIGNNQPYTAESARLLNEVNRRFKQELNRYLKRIGYKVLASGWVNEDGECTHHLHKHELLRLTCNRLPRKHYVAIIKLIVKFFHDKEFRGKRVGNRWRFFKPVRSPKAIARYVCARYLAKDIGVRRGRYVRRAWCSEPSTWKKPEPDIAEHLTFIPEHRVPELPLGARERDSGWTPAVNEWTGELGRMWIGPAYTIGISDQFPLFINKSNSAHRQECER